MRHRINDVLNLNKEDAVATGGPSAEPGFSGLNQDNFTQGNAAKGVFMPGRALGLSGIWAGLREVQILPAGTLLEAKRQLRAVGIVVLALLTVGVFLALLSYDDLDTSFNTASWRDTPANRLGASGAHFSDLVFQLYGYAAWLIPLFLACWLVFGVLKIWPGRSRWVLRCCLAPFTVLAAAAVFARAGIRTGWSKPEFSGGAGGDLLLSAVTGLSGFPEWFVTLVFLVLAVTGFYYCAGLPSRILGFFPWFATTLLGTFTVLGREAMRKGRPSGGADSGQDPFAAFDTNPQGGIDRTGDAARYDTVYDSGYETGHDTGYDTGGHLRSGEPVFFDPGFEADPQGGIGDAETPETKIPETGAPKTGNPNTETGDLAVLYDGATLAADDAGWNLYRAPVNLTVSNQSLNQYGTAATTGIGANAPESLFDGPGYRRGGDGTGERVEEGADAEDGFGSYPVFGPEPREFAREPAPIPAPDPAPNLTPTRASEPATKFQKRVKPEPSTAKGSLRYKAPSLDILARPSPAETRMRQTRGELEETAGLLTAVLAEFGVKGQITNVRPGPVVTLYELQPAPGTKTARVVNLADDIARSMSAFSARIATVPGRNVIGIELPNPEREIVMFREMLECPAYQRQSAKLPIALGKDIGGSPVFVDLTKMPHLLVAGTTGSGKSVAINTMILSLLYSQSPEICKFIMIDPKMLELSVYDGIPHLLSPVVTEPKKAVVALNWAVREMEERYRLMSNTGVRNIDGFNKRIGAARKKGEILKRKVQTGFDVDTGTPVYEEQEIELKELPFIVIIVDEMADLMLVAGKEIEGVLQRLAQMARAAGIHMVTATQRPSVDVITGTIKANFPSRISFSVTSKIDSRTILGEMGAEQLLGQGDMLYMPNSGRIQRVHGPFASDDEVEAVVSYLRDVGEPEYIDAISEEVEETGTGAPPAGKQTGDDLYDRAVAVVLREKKASTSFVQRHLQIGYNRAARLIEQMETEGLVSKADRVGRREIYAGNQGEDVL